MGETYRRTNITATLHRSLLYDGVAKLNPLLSEDTHLELAKQHLKDPQTLRNKIIWSDEPHYQAVFEGDQLCSSQEYSVLVSASCCGAVFQRQGLS